jgi:hypothetical protein
MWGHLYKSRKHVLHSPLSPGTASEVLRRSIDQEHLTAFSLSGFAGGRPILGEVGFDSFRLRKRISYRNDFARQFYGRLEPETGGTRIEGHFGIRLFPKIFMTIWFSGVISIGAIIFVETVRDLLRGGRPFDNHPWIGLLAPPGMLLFGIGLLWFCLWLSRSGEEFILQHLKTTLSARVEQPDSIRGLS